MSSVDLASALRDVCFGPTVLRWPEVQRHQPLWRAYRPTPTVAFSTRDCRSDRLPAAAQAALMVGYAPVRRGPGGRPVAYGRATLCIDVLGSEKPDQRDTRERFEVFGACIASALRSLGVPAGVGETPGEYCPGQFSVHDGHGHKVVGTAQRLVKGAWLFSAVVLVGPSAGLRPVMRDVYDLLQLSWDPSTLGTLAEVAPGVDVPSVATAVAEAFEGKADQMPRPLVERALAQAAREAPSHSVLPRWPPIRAAGSAPDGSGPPDEPRDVCEPVAPPG